MSARTHFRFEEDWSEIDADTFHLREREDARQLSKVILIAALSLCPRAVQQAMASSFCNIDAEGFPPLRMSKEELATVKDVRQQSAYYRRYSDNRANKSSETTNMVEVLAQRRLAQLFATDQRPDATASVSADEIFVNVQPATGAIANFAVLEALLEPGDIILSMGLSYGGHLSHGSDLHCSSKYYRTAHYGVDSRTGKLDYDQIEELALRIRPKILIAGASSYPWEIDWGRLRKIVDKLPTKTYLMADIAHPAGLVAAGLFPNPVGYADVTTLVTYKTLCGPRGAAILTTDADVSWKIDRAVFPGLQSSPILQNIVAMAVGFKIAQSEDFLLLQQRVVANARFLAKQLQERGIEIAYGGTNSHLVVIDLNGMKSAAGDVLNGDIAARILDLSHIVCNKNVLPGDRSAATASGLRLGTTWVSQLGMAEPEIEQIAETIHRVLSHIRPFHYIGVSSRNRAEKAEMRQVLRGKLPYDVLEEAKGSVMTLLASVSESTQAIAPPALNSLESWAGPGPTSASNTSIAYEALVDRDIQIVGLDHPLSLLQISGERARPFMQGICAANIFEAPKNVPVRSFIANPDRRSLTEVIIFALEQDSLGRDRFLLAVHAERAGRLLDWMQALSDGYILFGHEDILAKIDGPVLIDVCAPDPDGRHSDSIALLLEQIKGDEQPRSDPRKPFYIGQRFLDPQREQKPRKPEFFHQEQTHDARRTALYQAHLGLGARLIPFAGWEMPVWYSRIADEYRAVRQTAALFDLGHMGIFEISGADATWFLDAVTTNSLAMLAVGESCYSLLLDPRGSVMDDCYLYHLEPQRYMMVVNAVNTAKMLAWLRAVNSRDVLLDYAHPSAEVLAASTIRDLQDVECGADRRANIALQGPQALLILQQLAESPKQRRGLAQMQRNQVMIERVGDYELIIARTGYTGETIGFELFVHPDSAVKLWSRLLELGRPYGLLPAGLGARDAARIEAGFPLYGQELAGPHDVSPIEAGYGAFVKFHKPFFIGRSALLAKEPQRSKAIVRFRASRPKGKMIRPGNPLIDARGECIGFVTSCSLIEDHQMGMALVSSRHAPEGAALGIYALGADLPGGRSTRIEDLRVGSRLPPFVEVTVLPRF